MRIRLYQKTEDNLFYFQFLTKEGQLILDSQGYQSKDARNTGVNSVKANASNAERYEMHTEGSNHYFILKAGNNQEIARSAMFASKGEMAEAMNTLYVKAGGKGTPPAKTEASKEYVGKKGDDNYRPLAVYEKKTKSVDTGFGTFAEDDGHFFFAFNVDGKTILLSESYTSVSGRDNGVKSVTKNMVNADRYVRKVHSNGKHYFNLMAGNNQEIATSRWFDNEGEMNDAIASLTRGGGDGELVAREGYKAHVEIEAPVVTNESAEDKKPKKKRKKSDKPKVEKVILKEGNYLFNDVTYHTMRSGNGKHYFSFKNPEGKTILLSANVRGYETEADVDAAVQRVMEFGPYEGNYEGKTTKNDKFYFYLNDNDGGRVGKSFFFNTTEDMQAAIGLFIGDMKAATPPAAPAKKEAKVDDYLPCGDYSGGEWFHTFFRGDREEHYFAYNSPDGKTYLRSEGYTTEKARDNGMESVKKNAPIEARWTTGTALNEKYHYYALKAGNHQEIARSCYYSSVAEMQTAFAWVRGEQSILGEGAEMVDGKWWTAYMFRMKKEEEAAAAKKQEELRLAAIAKEEEAARLKAEAEAKREAEEARLKAEEEKKAMAAKAAAAAAALALKQKEEEELKLAAAKKIEEAKPKDKEDDYLPCKAYQGHAVNDKINNVAFFKHENGQFYFVMYDENGDVKLRSEGFRTSKERDQELSGVVRLHNDAKYYSKKEVGHHYMDILKDETGREVGRSCAKKVVTAAEIAAKKAEEEKARALALKLEEEKKAAAAAAVAAAAAAALALKQKEEEELKLAAAKKIEEAKPKDKEDDYLPCKAYQGHAVNDKINNVAFFKHENGQFYFVMYDKNGDVKLRSEGFRTSEERDQELSGVVRLHNDAKYYSKKEVGRHYMDILKDETGREVGRSCAKKVVTAAEIAAKKAEAEKATALALKLEEEKKATVAKAAAAAAATAAAAMFWKREVRDNDFMHCNEYKGHQVNDKHNKVAFFKKNGQFYFAVYDNGGNVKLRSEAFETVENRDTVLKAVLKNINDKNRYFKRDKNDYSWKVLKDNSGRVLAWSCAEKKKAAVVAPVAVAAVTTAAAAVATKTVVKEEKKGGFPWWLLALLGLLLLGLLYWQGCFGCNTAKVVAPPVPEVTHEEPKVQEPAVIEKSAEELEAEKARIIEEKAVREREAAEQVTPAIGVDAGFERVNVHK